MKRKIGYDDINEEVEIKLAGKRGVQTKRVAKKMESPGKHSVQVARELESPGKHGIQNMEVDKEAESQW